MEIVVKGRRTEVPERYRRHVIKKLAKLEKLAEKVIAVDVELSRERNPRLADQCERVAITLRGRGPVLRAEACAGDPYAALDLACAKLESRMRRAADRRRVHHGRRTPVSVASATALGGEAERRGSEPIGVNGRIASAETLVGPPKPDEAHLNDAAPTAEPAAEPAASPFRSARRRGPLIVREEVRRAAPMSLDQALSEMERVGHEFFPFLDVASGRPSVVYRRRGYDYGLIRLEEEKPDHQQEARRERAVTSARDARLAL